MISGWYRAEASHHPHAVVVSSLLFGFAPLLNRDATVLGVVEPARGGLSGAVH